MDTLFTFISQSNISIYATFEQMYGYLPFSLSRELQYPGNVIAHSMQKLAHRMDHPTNGNDKKTLEICFSKLINITPQHINTFNTKDTVVTLYNITKINYNHSRDSYFLISTAQLLLDRLLYFRREATPHNLTLALWSTVNIPGLTISAEQAIDIIALIYRQLDQLIPQDISLSLWSLAMIMNHGRIEIKQLPPNITKGLISRFAVLLPQTITQNLGNILFAVAAFTNQDAINNLTCEDIEPIIIKLHDDLPLNPDRTIVAHGIWAYAIFLQKFNKPPNGIFHNMLYYVNHSPGDHPPLSAAQLQTINRWLFSSFLKNSPQLNFQQSANERGEEVDSRLSLGPTNDLEKVTTHNPYAPPIVLTPSPTKYNRPYQIETSMLQDFSCIVNRLHWLAQYMENVGGTINPPEDNSNTSDIKNLIGKFNELCDAISSHEVEVDLNLYIIGLRAMASLLAFMPITTDNYTLVEIGLNRVMYKVMADPSRELDQHMKLSLLEALGILNYSGPYPLQELIDEFRPPQKIFPEQLSEYNYTHVEFNAYVYGFFIDALITMQDGSYLALTLEDSADLHSQQLAVQRGVNAQDTSAKSIHNKNAFRDLYLPSLGYTVRYHKYHPAEQLSQQNAPLPPDTYLDQRQMFFTVPQISQHQPSSQSYAAISPTCVDW